MEEKREQELKQELKETRQELKETKQKLNADRLAAAREFENEVASRTITMITTALALVAALFWQTAINDAIKAVIPISGAWEYELAVALGVTVLAAAVIYILTKSADGFRKA